MKAKRKSADAPLLESLILYGSPKYIDPKDWSICRLVWQGEGHIVIEYQERSGGKYLQLSTDDHFVASGSREYLRALQQRAIEKLDAETQRVKAAEAELSASTAARIKAFDVLQSSIRQGAADAVCPPIHEGAE